MTKAESSKKLEDYSGPTNTMGKMFDLMSDNKIPVSFVDKQFVEDAENKEIIKTFEGIQLRSKDFGFDNWSTVYTPVGYILKADNILAELKQKISEASTDSKNICYYQNSSVIQIN